jgi:hypothetical protein
MSKVKNPNDPIFYVYIYLNPLKPGKYSYCNGNIEFDHEPFYVGKGQGERYLDHLGEAEDTEDQKTGEGNHHKRNIIRKIWRETGEDPIIIFYEEALIELVAFHIEILLIAKIGRHDKKLGPLANLTDGGEGQTGNPNPWLVAYNRSEEGRRKHSLGHIGLQVGEKHGMFGKGYKVLGEKNGMFGKHHTEETCKKNSDWHLGRPQSEMSNWKRSESHRKRYEYITLVCPVCGQEFEVTIHNFIVKHRKTCSHSCSNKYRSWVRKGLILSVA